VSAEVPDHGEGPVAAGIAAALRTQRVAAGLSMRALAARAGMSQPFLSNLENARAMPSIATLYRIAHALGVSPRDFLPTQGAAQVSLVRAGEGAIAPVGDEDGSATSHVVAGAPGRMIEARTYDVAPGASLGEWFEHPGEDLLVVLEGEVLVELADGTRHELRAGDVLWHVATIAHRWTSRSAATTRLLLVNARPATPDTAQGPAAHGP
jgi:transcriptional regulator with XRE-family HTH domain